MKQEMLTICKYPNPGGRISRPLHATISWLWKMHDLKWLCTKIVNNCHTNINMKVKEMLLVLGDLKMKVVAYIKDVAKTYFLSTTPTPKLSYVGNEQWHGCA